MKAAQRRGAAAGARLRRLRGLLRPRAGWRIAPSGRGHARPGQRLDFRGRDAGAPDGRPRPRGEAGSSRSKTGAAHARPAGGRTGSRRTPRTSARATVSRSEELPLRPAARRRFVRWRDGLRFGLRALRAARPSLAPWKSDDAARSSSRAPRIRGSEERRRQRVDGVLAVVAQDLRNRWGASWCNSPFSGLRTAVQSAELRSPSTRSNGR